MDLERDGFQGAQTVSALSHSRHVARGGVVLVDEAGQIGGRQMHQLLTLATSQRGRVILSGDTRQHGAVEASDALRAIEKYSGLAGRRTERDSPSRPGREPTHAPNGSGLRSTSKLWKKRQKENSTHRSVVWIVKGRLWFVRHWNKQSVLPSSYLALAEQRQSVVVVSQTWSEIHRVNEQVRAALKSRGLLGGEDQTVTALETVDLTDAQKRDGRFYKDNTVLVLNQQCRRVSERSNVSAVGHQRQRFGSGRFGQDSHGPVSVRGSAHRLPAYGTRSGGR